MWSSVHVTHLVLFFICTIVFHTRDFSSISCRETSAGAFPLCFIALVLDLCHFAVS